VGESIVAEANISRFLRDPDLHMTVGRLFLTLAGSHESETEETFANANQMIDTLAFVTALLVETDPAANTPQRLRLSAEEFGRRVHAFAKAIRDQTAQAGTPVIMNFGGLRAVQMDANSSPGPLFGDESPDPAP